MKKSLFNLSLIFVSMLISCNNSSTGTQSESSATTEVAPGQSAVVDDISNPNIVQVAVGSKDHTTLVAAVKAAGLVDALSNTGPFTVFAPVNDAFENLPEKSDLENILGYHTYVGVLKPEYMSDGQQFDMVFGGKVNITKKGAKTFVNGSEIIASIPTSNGIIHVIGDVLLPK